jgi:hypothetical protein
MEGISLASGAADVARHRNEASGLAEMQLNYLIASGDWNNGVLDGNFGSDGINSGDDWAGIYSWHASVSPWSGDLTETVYELDMTVSWLSKNNRDEDSVSISTLVYDKYDQYNTYQTNLEANSSTTSGTTAGG